MPPEERRGLYVAVPRSRKSYHPCRALSVPSSPVFAFKANAMVDMNDAGTAGTGREVYMQVGIADHVVTVFMQFLARALPWSNERLEDMVDYGPRMGENQRGGGVDAITDGDIENGLLCTDLPNRFGDAVCSSAGSGCDYVFVHYLLEPHRRGGLVSV